MIFSQKPGCTQDMAGFLFNFTSFQNDLFLDSLDFMRLRAFDTYLLLF